MAPSNTQSGRSQPFLASNLFLAVLAVGLTALSIVVWKAQEASNLAQLRAKTEANAIALSSDAEIRYRGIVNAVNRLAGRGRLDTPQKEELWIKDAAFYIDSFAGLETIHWIDRDYMLRLSVPTAAGEGLVGQLASAIPLLPSQIRLLAPVYTGSRLEGFVLGIVDLPSFTAPLTEDLLADYAVQLLNEANAVYVSENWTERHAGDEVRESINLQDAQVLNLFFAPTEQHWRLEATSAQRSLAVSLTLSALMLSSVFFAQNYWALSRLNAARYRELLEQVDLVAVTLDLEGRVTFCNDYLLQLTGWPREEVLGQEYFPRFAPSNWQQVKETILSRLRSEDMPAHAENPLLTRSGDVRWVRFNNTILRNTKGEVIGVASIGEDVTERRLAEARIQQMNAELEQRVRERTRQLEAANRELEAFSYSVSHDLRSPLRGIDGWSLALLEDYGDQLDPQAQSYLHRVRSETQRMARLIDDLLNLARLARAEMRCQPVDLSAMAARLTATLQASAPQRQVTFVIQPGLTAIGDANLLEIALSNLLDNAFKFTSKTAQARIEFGQVDLDGQPAFVVRDNGAGFDPAYAQKLFGPFQRMHKASEFPGTGIGLTIVQRIIHRHGGKIWADAAPAQGAGFYFTLDECYRQEDHTPEYQESSL